MRMRYTYGNDKTINVRKIEYIHMGGVWYLLNDDPGDSFIYVLIFYIIF